MLARHAPCSPPHAFLVVLAGSQQNMAGAVEYLRAHPVPGAMYNTSRASGRRRAHKLAFKGTFLMS
jgi:hypothetical protein